MRELVQVLGCRPITCTDAQRGSLGHLNHKGPTDKDNRSSLCTK